MSGRYRPAEPVMQIRNGRQKAQEPSTAELLAALIARINAAVQAAQEREEREIARHAELLAKIDEAELSASQAAYEAEMVRRELESILYPPPPVD
jgi:hypothetical protein